MNFIYQVFGWPMGLILSFFYNITGDYVFSLILFTIFVQILMLPLTLKTKKSMAQQTALQPFVQRVQQQFSNNREKAAAEQQKLYDITGVSMMSGCITPLLQFPLIFGMVDVVYKPLTHILRINSETAGKILAIAKDLGANIAEKSLQGEIIAFPYVKQNPEAFLSVGKDVVDKISGLDMTIFGLDLSQNPEGIFSKLGIFVILSAVMSLLQMVINQYISKKSAPAGAPQTSKGMNVMMIFMGPVFSIMIGLSWPAAISFYWGIRYFVSTIQEIIIDKIKPQKIIVEKYTLEFGEKIKENERKNKGKNKKKTPQIDETIPVKGKSIKESTNNKSNKKIAPSNEVVSTKLEIARRRMEERYSQEAFNKAKDEDEATIVEDIEEEKNNDIKKDEK